MEDKGLSKILNVCPKRGRKERRKHVLWHIFNVLSVRRPTGMTAQ